MAPLRVQLRRIRTQRGFTAPPGHAAEKVQPLADEIDAEGVVVDATDPDAVDRTIDLCSSVTVASTGW